MRTIAPLNEESWNILVTDLEKGPSEEQVKYILEALKNEDPIEETEY